MSIRLDTGKDRIHILLHLKISIILIVFLEVILILQASGEVTLEDILRTLENRA